MKTTQPTCLHRLARDQRGAIAITFALTFAGMLGGTLFAVDMVRYSATQSRLQNALDAAVISAGRKLADYKPTQGGEPGQGWKDDAYAFFRANMPARYLGSDIPLDTLNIAYSEERVGDTGQYLSGQVLHMTVSGKMPLLSTGFNDIAPMNVHATNSAIRRVRNDLELVLALDNTGSMGDASGSKQVGEKTKLDVLKKSARGMIETVMAAAAAGGQTDGVSGAYIGLVPFTDSVNVKDISTAKSWLEQGGGLQNRADLRNAIDQVWGGCILEPRPPASGWTTQNKLPAAVLSSTAGFMPMISTYSFDYTPRYVNSDVNNSYRNNYLLSLSLAGNGIERYQFLAPTGQNVVDRRIRIGLSNDSRPDDDTPLEWWSSGTTGQRLSQLPKSFRVNLAMDSQYCTQSRAMFLNRNQAALTSSVDDMIAYGGTSVPTGLLWAWRMLSPAWTGAWDGSELPREGGPKLRKVIVLLSDGDNQPVVRRGSVAASSKQVFRLSYAYATCNRTSGSGNNATCVRNGNTAAWANPQTVLAEQVSLSISTFNQCPIDGLLTVDPSTMTPNNYNANCVSTPATSANSNQTGYSTRNGVDGLSTAAVNAYMTQLCRNVKADTSSNIQIYTLTLGKDVTASAKTVMQGCATDADHYFDVSNAAELPDVFAQIAGALTELRLTQ